MADAFGILPVSREGVFALLQSFGWIFFVVVGLVIAGIAATQHRRRKKRAAEERRALWKAHQEWLRTSGAQPPQRDLPPRQKDGPRVGHG
jgi:hypothetical protein